MLEEISIKGEEIMGFWESFFSISGSKDFEVGDWVYIKSYGCYGTIIDIVGDNVYVDVDDDDAEDDDTVEVFEKSDLSK